MMRSGREQPAERRITARGEATRARLVSAAADLMYVRGVNAVTLDDVRAATGASKSQLYKHFPTGKPELVRAVVALRAEQILVREEERLARLKSMNGLRRWRNSLVQAAALQGGAHGCALGNLAVELSDQDEQARVSLSEHFAAWERLMAKGFQRMRDNGILNASADPDELATGLMAALQGGYLLAQVDHDVAPMASALDMALAHIESLTTPSAPQDAEKAAEKVKVQHLTAAGLRRAIDAGVVIFDARSSDDFASAHLRGSLNVRFSGSVAVTADDICDRDDAVAVVVYPGDEHAVATLLAKSSFDNVSGFFALRSGAAFPAKLDDIVQSSRRISPGELESMLAEEAVTVIDIRGKGDRACGIPNAIEMTLPQLRRRWHAIPTDKPIVVHSAGDGRSAAAASLLRANGLEDVSDLSGGPARWERRPSATKTPASRKSTTSPRRSRTAQARRRTLAEG